MPNYRRVWCPGGTCFFTATLLERHHNDLLVRHIDALRQVVAHVRSRHPFTIHGWVVLPDHLHCVIELPSGDANYAMRWALIKQRFSKAIPATEHRNEARQRRAERGIWQRRYWEHPRPVPPGVFLMRLWAGMKAMAKSERNVGLEILEGLQEIKRGEPVRKKVLPAVV